MSIFDHRAYYKPFNYPWAFEYFRQQNQVHWLPEEVPLHDDVKDWNTRLSGSEKNLLTQLFRFFTQGDVDVAEGYYDKFIPLFPQPELRQMLGSFAAMEGIHVHAYSLLLDTIGMEETEYQAFHEYEEMRNKHNYVAEIPIPKKIDTVEDTRAVARAIAVYSAFTEGLQLFSSFAILLNFQRVGKMKGMGQIVTWSVRDESLHVEGMIRLFRTIIEENPSIWTDEFKGLLYETNRKMVELEDKFIDLCFIEGGIDGLQAEEVKEYIRYISDLRLSQLGLKPNYMIEKHPLPWLNAILNGVEHANFFETRSTEYSKASLSGSWDSVWKTISHSLEEAK